MPSCLLWIAVMVSWARGWALEQKAGIVDVVQHDQPSVLALAQPVVHEFRRDFSLWVLLSSDRNAVGNVAEH
jgi:hypothetical protein